MSLQQMRLVWEHSKAKGNSRLVLLAIADFANDAGVAWPAVDTIAKMARACERNVQQCFEQLCSIGELAIDRQQGRQGCNKYRILLAPPPANNAPPQNLHPANPAPLDGEKPAAGGATFAPPQNLRGDPTITGGVQSVTLGGDPRITRSVRSPIDPSVGESQPTGGARNAGVQNLRGANFAGGEELDTASLDYPKAEALLAHLNSQTGLNYPPNRAALDAAAIALHAVGQDLEGAKRAVTRQVTLYKADTRKAHWLRPSTLFERARFADLYAERELAIPGIAAAGPNHSRRLQLQEQLKTAAGPDERQAIRQELQALEEHA